MVAGGAAFEELPPTARRLLSAKAAAGGGRPTRVAELARWEIELDGPVTGGLVVRLPVRKGIDGDSDDYPDGGADEGAAGAVAAALRDSRRAACGRTVVGGAPDRVGVGGAYFIISRSLGLEVGGAIGLPLFLSQALSVTLYAYGLAESLRFVWAGVPVPVAAFRTSSARSRLRHSRLWLNSVVLIFRHWRRQLLTKRACQLWRHWRRRLPI